MKKFILLSLLAAAVALAVDVAVIACRVALAQGAVADALSVPPGTEAVFIGNSHTGCTFTEAPEFRNRVIWRSATGFACHYLRFLELERRGAFDGAVKTCIVDCDRASLLCCSRTHTAQDFIDMLPLTWRHWDRTLLTKTELVRAVLAHPNIGFSMRETPPPEVPNWTTRTAKEREQFNKTGDAWRFRMADVASNAYPHDWQNRLLEMIRDMKARCDRHGVRLILFASPVASDCPDRTNPDVWEMASSFAVRVRALGVEYLDYRLSCPDEKFRDSGHLLPSASAEFTRRFYREILMK